MNRNRNPARWLSLGALLLGALSRLPAAEVEAEAGSAGAVTTLFA